jgi:carboxyl-terminal processing protease
LSADRRRGFIAGLVAGIALTAGAVLIADAADVGPFAQDKSVVSEALQTIEDNYYRPVDPKFIDSSSIDGVLTELKRRFGDKFSHYFDSKTFGLFQSATNGNFQGIGLTVNGVSQGLRIVHVISNTPAERAGIKEGETIIWAAGHSLRGLSADAGAALIKGEPGTPVKLRIVPKGGGKPRALTVNRAEVSLPAAKGAFRKAAGDKVAYVRFATFSAGAHGQLQQAIDRRYRGGAKGLVLDMRGNGGGLLNEAVLCASLFLKQGKLVVSTKSRTQGSRKYDAVGGTLAQKPVVVLIDKNTASAAEILTAALQDNGVATVVGTRSYGKGVFQDVIPLQAGGALDLTIGRYFTPDGTSLAGKGIKPDVHAADDPKTKTVDEGLQRALAVLGRELHSGRATS